MAIVGPILSVILGAIAVIVVVLCIVAPDTGSEKK
jgi:hypothetical protein